MAKKKEAAPETAGKEVVNAESLISKAIDKDVPVETMERLLVIRTQLKFYYRTNERGNC